MSGSMKPSTREIILCGLTAVLCFCLATSMAFGQTAAKKKKAPAKPAATATPAPEEQKPAEVKPPAKLRIGIAPADMQTGQNTNGQPDYGAAVRDSLVTLMSGPAMEIVPLNSHIAVQLMAEAADQHCDFVVLSTVTLKHTTSGFGRLMKSAGVVSNAMPMVALSKMAANKAAAVAMTAQQQTASSLAAFEGQIKAKDELSLNYHVMAPGQQTAKAENSLKATAKADKEDVLSPLMQDAANNILTEITKK